MTKVPIQHIKQTWTPVFPWIPQCLHVAGPSWLAFSTSTLNFSSPESRIPFTSCLSFPIEFNHFGHLTFSSTLFGPPGCFFGFSSLPLPSPLFSHGSVWSCPLWSLSDIHESVYALPHIYNKIYPPPHLGEVMFLSFFFLSFFFIQTGSRIT